MTSDLEYECMNCGHEGINTRAVPDVPELVRYGLVSLFGDKKIAQLTTGEYVRHDQAADMFAAKDSEKALKDTGLKIAMSKIEALEAKLAQIEKPIGYVSKSFFESLKIDRFHSIAAYVLRESSERYSEPLYTAPVASEPSDKQALQVIADLQYGKNDDITTGHEDAYRAVESLFTSPPNIVCSAPVASYADLRAEIERLRKSLEKIASLSHTTGLLWWQIEARKALNPSEPRT